MTLTQSLAPALLAGTFLTAVAAADATVTFDEGAEGWTGPTGGTVIDPTGGNPGANMHTVYNNFGINFTNATNPEFVADYTQFDTVTFSVDVKVNDISFFGTPATRPWVLELRDYDDVPDPYPWVSVWYEFAWIGAGPDWVTWSVTIADTGVDELPPGWGGYGAETDLGEPILPPDRTFADVLAGIDEVVLTTYEPGWFFGFTDFDIRLDNISIATTGSPACPGDVDGDGVTGFSDLVVLLSAWSTCPTGEPCPSDLDDDGIVGIADLILLLSLWGPCP
jgi:hypothetical protein